MYTADLRKTLLSGFIFLGPLGNLLTPHFFPSAFRAYYFLLLGFPILFTRIREKQMKLLILFSPFFLYCFFSAFYVHINGRNPDAHPLFRFFLFATQFLFILGASSLVTTEQEKFETVALYLKAYFYSLLIGYLFYIGFYLGLVSFELIERFSVLGQFGYGLLRFSPGSYANEYGIVTSFALSILTLILLENKESQFHLSRRAVIVFFALTFIALLFTTTRAAYLSYLFSLFYLSRRLSRTLLWLPVVFIFLILALRFFEIDMFAILSMGFNFASLENGTTLERVSTWIWAFKEFQTSPLFGLGFAAIANLHNVYLELFFEIGVIGTVLLVGTLLFAWAPVQVHFGGEGVLKKIRTLGLMHVLWFAMSNHNLNHHLTWFVFFLFAVEAVERVPTFSFGTFRRPSLQSR